MKALGERKFLELDFSIAHLEVHWEQRPKEGYLCALLVHKVHLAPHLFSESIKPLLY